MFIQLQGKEKFLEILHHYMEVHGTVYYETQRPPEVPAFVKNHGLLPQQDLQQLLRKAKVTFYTIQSLAASRSVFYPSVTLFYTESFNSHPALYWIRFSLRRPRPFRSDSQRMHFSAAQISSSSQLA